MMIFLWLFSFNRSQLLERCGLLIAVGKLKLISSVYVKLVFSKKITTVYFSFLLFFISFNKRKKNFFFKEKKNQFLYLWGKFQLFWFLEEINKKLCRKTPKKTAQGEGKETPKNITLPSTEVINYSLRNVKQWYSSTQRFCWSSP